MKDDFTQSKRDKQGQRLHLFIGIIGLLALFAVAEYVTFGQIRVRRGGGRARGVRYGARGSIRYGQHYSSGARYGDHYAHGARYRRASSGMLPSAGRYGYMARGMGTIRYGAAPVRSSVPARPKIPAAVAVRPRPYAAPAISPKTYTPSRAYSAQGSIRYGAAKSFSAKSVQRSKSLSPAGKKVSPFAPETVLAKRSTTSLKISRLAYSNGSIRYARAGNIAPTMAPKTSGSKSTIIPQKKQIKLSPKSPTKEPSKNK